MRPTGAVIVSICFLALVAGAAAFLVVRANVTGGSAQAEPEHPQGNDLPGRDQARETPAPPQSPAPVATAEGLPGLPAEPAAFEPGWAEPYYEADRARPRYDQVINGINVGPDVRGEDRTKCAPGAGHWSDPEEARGTQVWVDPTYLPDDALEDGEPRFGQMVSIACDGVPTSLEVTIGRKAAPDVMERIALGESWFDIPTGGYITIVRSSIRGPNVISSEASERWYGTTIGRLPAAVAKPILERGLGEAWAATWDPETGILTVVRGLNMTADDVIRIAEGLQ